MKTIGISEFKELVNSRLVNPKSFVGKSLVLWNASYMHYGIAYRAIEECCKEYNKANPDKQVWFKFSDMDFASADYANIQECCEIKEMYGFKSRGILFNTGCWFMPEEKEHWLKFVNTHQNEKGKISADWALIACAHTEGTGITETDFAENCEIFKLHPTVDEWKKWTASCHDEDFIRLVIAYTHGNIEDFDFWERVLDGMEEDYDSIEELRCTTFKDFDDLRGFIPGFPTENFWNFIQEYLN